MLKGKKGSKKSTGKSQNKNQNQGEQYFYEIGKDNKNKGDKGTSESEDMY